MFERLIIRGAALAGKAARRRRDELAEALREEAEAAGIRVEESEEGVALSGRGLARLALEPALRWLLTGRPR